LFHGQFLETRINRLAASLGGLMGPCSKFNVAIVFITPFCLVLDLSDTSVDVDAHDRHRRYDRHGVAWIAKGAVPNNRETS
jgi:hypothetical protein